MPSKVGADARNEASTRSRISATPMDMTTEKPQPQSNAEEHLVLFRHRFDRESGAYVSSEPVDYVRTRELLASLEAVNRESLATIGTNFVVEVVPLEEVTACDFRLLLECLRANDEMHRADAAIGAYVSERLAA